MESFFFVFMMVGESIVTILQLVKIGVMSNGAHYLYNGSGSNEEIRFIHNNTKNPFIYPEIPLKLISYNRHLYDRNEVLIPDYEFIVHQFSQFMLQENKIPQIFWRGIGHSIPLSLSFSTLEELSSALLFSNHSYQRYFLNVYSSL
jgi:hypothetical protein